MQIFPIRPVANSKTFRHFSYRKCKPLSRILRWGAKQIQQQRLTTGASSKKKQGGPAYHTWYNANRALSAFKAYCELFLSSKDLAFEKIDVQLVQRYRQHCL